MRVSCNCCDKSMLNFSQQMYFLDFYFKLQFKEFEDSFISTANVSMADHLVLTNSIRPHNGVRTSCDSLANHRHHVTIIDNYHLQDVLSQIRQLDYLLSKAQDIKIADR